MITFLIWCVIPVIVNADTESEAYLEKLEKLRSSITTVEASLDEDKSSRGRVRSELKKLEKKLAHISKELNYTKYLVKNRKKSLKILKIELKKLENELKSQKQSLASQLRAAHMLGSNETMKLLLNQQDPVEFGRAFVYYDYLNRARGKQINTYLDKLTEKTRLQEDIIKQTDELVKLVSEQSHQKTRLLSHRAERNQLISQLNTKITSNEDALVQLQTHRKRIEELLISLGQLLADIPATPTHIRPFAELQGLLPWPIKGTITSQYGSIRHQTDLVWNGVVISSEYDTPVHAISYGRVVYADWLQGYGFITIIDHGSGFMSLYGYNQNLLKQPGDWVEAGEIIASVGDSGGQTNSGLYFEIRQQGKPVNPDKWCSNQHTHFVSR